MNQKTDFITELVVWSGAGALSWPSGHLNLTVNMIGSIIVTCDIKIRENKT
jgi:hypothetical protein